MIGYYQCFIHIILIGWWWGRASSFGFLCVGSSVGKKPNVLDHVVVFLVQMLNVCQHFQHYTQRDCV